MPLIHTYKYQSCGGIADFLRSVFAYYIYCLKNNIPYYLHIDDHPFQLCFYNTNNQLPEHHKTNLHSLCDVASKTSKNTLDILEKIKDLSVNYIILSNIFDFIPFEEFGRHRESFLKFLSISDIVKIRIRELLSNDLITSSKYLYKPYNAIHIRLGDKFMPQINIQSDIRMSNDPITSVKKAIEFLGKDKPILIVSDNLEIKKLIKDLDSNIFILNSKIHHSALPSNNIMDFIDTVSEFVILGSADTIVSLAQSGFPFWSSIIFGRPLYLVSNEEVVKYTFENLKY